MKLSQPYDDLFMTLSGVNLRSRIRLDVLGHAPNLDSKQLNPLSWVDPESR